jgi:hypothetical protein
MKPLLQGTYTATRKLLRMSARTGANMNACFPRSPQLRDSLVRIPTFQDVAKPANSHVRLLSIARRSLSFNSLKWQRLTVTLCMFDVQ